MAARKIIIDTDPGQDDAVALLLALASPEEVEVVAVVTVAGNVPLSHTTTNARQVLELAGRTDVPLYAGCARPMRRRLVTAEHVHGPTGIDGPALPAPTMPVQGQHGVQYVIEALRGAEAGSVTLVTLGPLTNIAMALVEAPDIAPRLREIVAVLGSWSENGNITPAAAFNEYVDPEAADVVFTSGVPLTMMPMDVAHQCLSTPSRLAALRTNGNACSVAAAKMLAFSEAFDMAKNGWEGAPLHDPCAIAYLIDPSIFGGRNVNVVVETAGLHTSGMTVVDWWRVTEREPNAHFLRPGSSRVASLARKKLAIPTPLRLRKLVSLRHVLRPETLDPERNEPALTRAENPECRLDLEHFPLMLHRIQRRRDSWRILVG